MRILHVGWGFSPWRSGGLIRYAEDLMAVQAAQGHEVHYLCSGRHYPRTGGLRVKRRRRGAVHVHELVNPPILVGLDSGTLVPERDLDEPQIERVFRRLLAEIRPDVVHVQELLGLPSSLLELARAAGVPVVMTLQDYFPLCPTLRLLDADGARCLRGVGPACAAACAGAPRDSGPLVARTLHFELARAKHQVPGLRRLDFDGLRGVLHPLVNHTARLGAEPVLPPRDGQGVSVERLQHRRDVNVERLSRVDALLAMSQRVEELYRRLGVDSAALRTLHLTLRHIEALAPRPPRRPGPLTFGAVDALAAPSKGGDLLVEAVQLLREAGMAGRFRVVVDGYVVPETAARLLQWPEAVVRGVFGPGEMDARLDDVDVGLILSTWEEAYGYIGPEFLAKGIPLIANARGGIVDYAREGETAWLNRSVTADELAQRMLHLIEHPEEVDAMAQRVRQARSRIVKPFARHAEEIEAVYRELAERPAAAVAAR
jgi:glycosyltransferase involved in cell wall biosynthesis